MRKKPLWGLGFEEGIRLSSFPENYFKSWGMMSETDKGRECDIDLECEEGNSKITT